MSTTYYNLPTINGTDTVDGVNAINGLANATDAALRQVANTVPSLDTVNAQIATLTQQVGSAQTTAQNAASAASQAQSTANGAQSTASAAQVTASEAAAKLAQKPKLYRPAQVSVSTYGAKIDSTFTVNPITQYAVIKVFITDGFDNLPTGFNQDIDLFDIPAEYQPSSIMGAFGYYWGMENGGATLNMIAEPKSEGGKCKIHVSTTNNFPASQSNVFQGQAVTFGYYYGEEEAGSI